MSTPVDFTDEQGVEKMFIDMVRKGVSGDFVRVLISIFNHRGFVWMNANLFNDYIGNDYRKFLGQKLLEDADFYVRYVVGVFKSLRFRSLADFDDWKDRQQVEFDKTFSRSEILGLGTNNSNPGITTAVANAFKRNAIMNYDGSETVAPPSVGTAPAAVPATGAGAAQVSSFGAPLQVPSTPSQAHQQSTHFRTPLRNNWSGLPDQGSYTSRTPIPGYSSNSLSAIGSTLTTPRRTGENINPNGLGFADLSIGGSTISSLDGRSQTGNNSNQLLKNAALDINHRMFLNPHAFQQFLGPVESDFVKFLLKTQDVEASKNFTGFIGFRRSVEVEEEHYNSVQNSAEDRLAVIQRNQIDIPAAANLERERIKANNKNALVQIDAERDTKLLALKEEYEANIRGANEEHARQKANLDAQSQTDWSLVDTNTRDTLAQLSTTSTQIQNELTRNKEEKERRLTLAKAHLLAIEKGFQLCDSLRVFHESKKDEDWQKYESMKQHHLQLLKFIADEKLNELKGSVWPQPDNDDDSL